MKLQQETKLRKKKHNNRCTLLKINDIVLKC